MEVKGSEIPLVSVACFKTQGLGSEHLTSFSERGLAPQEAASLLHFEELVCNFADNHFATVVVVPKFH